MKNYAERKRYIRSYGLAAATVLLLALAAGCDRAGSLPVVPLQVSADIAGAHTRADIDKNATNYEKKNNFETGDLINIRKDNAAESTAVSYQKGTNGWIPANTANQIKTSGNETFFASYPPEFTSILSDQSTYTNFWKSNRLTSTAKATANRVKFTFAPAAAKITVIVIYQVDNTAVSASVAGTNVCTEPSKANSLQLLRTSGDARRHTYTGILNTGVTFPYTISVKTKPGGGAEETKTYEEKGTSLALQPGYEYQYTFTTTNELILTSIVVKDFISTDEVDAGPAT